MDAPTHNEITDALYIDLINNEFELLEQGDINDTNLSIAPDISDLLKNVQEGEANETSVNSKAFEQTQPKLRFREVNNEDLDSLEDENNAQSTHWQTNWAVGVMRGTS